jgi:hypothetical protein
MPFGSPFPPKPDAFAFRPLSIATSAATPQHLLSHPFKPSCTPNLTPVPTNLAFSDLRYPSIPSTPASDIHATYTASVKSGVLDAHASLSSSNDTDDRTTLGSRHTKIVTLEPRYVADLLPGDDVADCSHLAYPHSGRCVEYRMTIHGVAVPTFYPACLVTVDAEGRQDRSLIVGADCKAGGDGTVAGLVRLVVGVPLGVAAWAVSLPFRVLAASM